MSDQLKELIEAGQELLRLAEKLNTMAAEYVNWNEQQRAVERWNNAVVAIRK